jgi:hypothetical protein
MFRIFGQLPNSILPSWSISMRPRTVLIALILLGLPGPLCAAPPKPTAVLQLKPIDEWLADLKYVATKYGPFAEKLPGDAGAAKPPADKLDVDKKLEDELAKVLGPDWRKAIDTTRPLGGYAIIKDKVEEGTFVGMLPVKDVKALLKTLGDFGVKPEEKDGLISIQLPNQGMTTIYARAANGYVYVGSSAESVAQENLLKPEDLFGAKETSALVLRFRMDSIPEEMKKRWMEELEKGMQQSLAGESKYTEDFAKSLFDSLRKVYRDGREFTLGLDFDRKAGEVALTVEIIPMPGTELAKEYREAKPNLSRFAALNQGETAYVGSACGLPLAMMFDEKERDKAVEELQKKLTQAGIKIDKAMAVKAMKIFAAAAPTDDTDFALILYPGEKGKDAILFGLHIKEGAKAEAALVELIKELPADVRDRVKLNAGKIGSANVHRIELGKDAPENFRKLYGTTEVAVVVAPDALYAAIGADAEGRIQAALRAKPKEAPLFTLDTAVAVLPRVMEGTASDDKQPTINKKALESLGKPTDRLRLVHLTRSSGESVKYRFGVNLVAILQIANAVSSTDSGTKPSKPAGKDAPKAPPPSPPPPKPE